MRYQHTTGLTRTQLTDLVARVQHLLPPRAAATRPYSIGLFLSVVIVLDWLRHHHTHAYLAERHGVSQPTITRLIHRVLPIVHEAATDLILPPPLPDRRNTPLLIDGTLIPTWNWRAYPENWSRKRHKPGVGIQVVSDLYGRLVDVSEPYSGSIHDRVAYTLSGCDEVLSDHVVIADAGYQGTMAVTPIKAGKLTPLSEQDKEFNTELTKLRAAVERCIAHLKAWKVLVTGYRRMLNSLPETISVVTALQFYRNSTSQYI